MAARQADGTSPRPRPRPSAAAEAAQPQVDHAPPASENREGRRSTGSAARNGSRSARRTSRDPGRGLARQQQAQTQQVVLAAGKSVVTAARVGRLLGRTGWRMAKQLPGVSAAEAQAQRLGQAMTSELARLLEIPQGIVGSLSPEEQRAVNLIQNSGGDAEPLRSAMTELLDRSAERDGIKSRDYLYGTIVSQLVPDEARILAALAGGKSFAALDVLAKQSGRSTTHVELSNASAVGAAAGISLTHNTGTYLTRLHGFGLIEFGPPTEDLDSQFDALREEPAVQEARARTDNGKTRTKRKSVSLSSFGEQFWSACAPSSGQIARRRR